MPQKRRKSFLELLTGASESAKTEDVSGRISTSTAGEEPAYSALHEEKPAAPSDTARHVQSEPQPQPEAESAALAESHRDENWLADSGEGQLTLDVYEVGDTVVIQSTIAGVNAEDLEVDINNDMVTIRGERKRDEDIPEGSFYYQELYWGPFSRSVILPVEVEAKKAEAELKNGILTVRLPKKESEKTHKIQVKPA